MKVILRKETMLNSAEAIRTNWLSACEADGNKPYQCLERWEHMQRGGE